MAGSLSFLADAACTANQEVDYLILAMTWQPGSCKSNKIRCKTNAPINDIFSIHGLWPQLNVGKLENCCTKHLFFSRKLDEIKRSLRALWPTITDGPVESFWQYEYDKHGTCAVGKVTGADDVKEYFLRTMAKFRELNLEQTLQAGGFKIKTSNTYRGSKILEYLDEKFGSKFQLTCKPYRTSKILVDIRACYDTKLRLIDCKNSNHACMGPITFQ